jgi:hypothetical protein
VNGNIRRVALQPARRIATGPGVGGVGDGDADGTVPTAAVAATAAAAAALAMMNNASLMPTPRNLHDLWHEYMHGIGGRKAARLFSSFERGRVKFKYSRRKVVWDLVAGLVRAGHTAERAIDSIYAVYGGSISVTNIINGLKRDKKDGTLCPNLCV